VRGSFPGVVVVRGVQGWAAHGEQEGAGVEEGGGGGVRVPVCARQRENERNGMGLNQRSSR
jgi:hypothetical protein